MKISEWIRENKGAIAFAAVIMLLGTAAYFAFGIKEGMGPGTDKEGMDNGTVKVDPAVFADTKYKVGFAPDGTIKVLAYAKNNALATLTAKEGKSIPEDNSMTIGYAEAEMMRKENLFTKPGDNLTDFFGIEKVYIGGVLEKTGTPVDDMHFLSLHNFEKVNGEEGRVFSKLTPDKVPKMFYYLGLNESVPAKFVLAEGGMSGYKVHDLGGAEYYPLILGSNEATMMREEKLFRETGDVIRGFFGRNIVVVGVLEQTNTSLDMMHFVPLKADWLS